MSTLIDIQILGNSGTKVIIGLMNRERHFDSTTRKSMLYWIQTIASNKR